MSLRKTWQARPRQTRPFTIKYKVEEGEGEETYAPLLAKVEPDSREFPANLMSEHKKGARLGATVLVGFLAILAKAVVIPLGNLIVGGILGVLKK